MSFTRRFLGLARARLVFSLKGKRGKRCRYSNEISVLGNYCPPQLNCTIPQISSLFTLLCDQKMVWQRIEIIGIFMPRMLVDTTYRCVSHKNLGEHQLYITPLSFKNPTKSVRTQKSLKFLIESAFWAAIRCKQAVSRAKRLLFVMRRAIAELLATVFFPG